MEINPDTVAWAIGKLSRFRRWQDFPVEEEQLESRARSFLRLVHNRPAEEIMQAALTRNRVAAPVEINWEAKGIDPQQNDADWILDTIEETMDRFPRPSLIREIYTAKLPAAVEVRKHQPFEYDPKDGAA